MIYTHMVSNNLGRHDHHVNNQTSAFYDHILHSFSDMSNKEAHTVFTCIV